MKILTYGLLGFILGVLAAAIIITMDTPVTKYVGPVFSTEKEVLDTNSVFLKYMPVVHSYKDEVITNRTERYYHRGTDWIMIKDFPEHTDKYEVIFKEVSEELWSE